MASATERLNAVPNIKYTETCFIISIDIWKNCVWLLYKGQIGTVHYKFAGHQTYHEGVLLNLLRHTALIHVKIYVSFIFLCY